MADLIATLTMIADEIEADLLDNGVEIDEEDRAVIRNVVARYLNRAESRATRAEQDADALAEALARRVEECRPFNIYGTEEWRCLCCLEDSENTLTIQHADGCTYAADVEALSQHAQHVARRGAP